MDEPMTTPESPPKVRAIELEAMRQYRAKYPDGLPWLELDISTRVMWLTHVEKQSASLSPGQQEDPGK